MWKRVRKVHVCFESRPQLYMIRKATYFESQRTLQKYGDMAVRVLGICSTTTRYCKEGIHVHWELTQESYLFVMKIIRCNSHLGKSRHIN